MITRFSASTPDTEFHSFCQSHKGFIFSAAESKAVMVSSEFLTPDAFEWTPAFNATFNVSIFYISSYAHITNLPSHEARKQYIHAKLLTLWPDDPTLLAIKSF